MKKLIAAIIGLTLTASVIHAQTIVVKTNVTVAPLRLSAAQLDGFASVIGSQLAFPQPVTSANLVSFHVRNLTNAVSVQATSLSDGVRVMQSSNLTVEQFDTAVSHLAHAGVSSTVPITRNNFESCFVFRVPRTNSEPVFLVNIALK